MENHTFSYDDELVIFDRFSKYSYFQGYTQNLTRPRIHRDRPCFRIDVFPKDNHTFSCVDGFVIFDQISILLHVLANIQNFDADLQKS